MGEQKTRYKYQDSDGDVQYFNHIQRWCRCCGNCEDDELEYMDPDDSPESPPYRLKNISGHEMKYFICDLIDIGITAGKITEIKNNEKN